MICRTHALHLRQKGPDVVLFLQIGPLCRPRVFPTTPQHNGTETVARKRLDRFLSSARTRLRESRVQMERSICAREPRQGSYSSRLHWILWRTLHDKITRRIVLPSSLTQPKHNRRSGSENREETVKASSMRPRYAMASEETPHPRPMTAGRLHWRIGPWTNRVEA